MKKFYSFLVAAVLLMGATSCQKEATADAGAADNVEFVASIAGGRTELGAGNKVMWNAGDNIRVYTRENLDGNIFNSDATAATATAKFTTTEQFTASNSGYFAVYPENTVIKVDQSTGWVPQQMAGKATYAEGVWSIPVSMKTEFYEDAGDVVPAANYYEENNFMVAFSENNQLSFKAATALLKFTYTGNQGLAMIFFTGDDCVTGNAVLKFNTADNSINYEEADGWQITLEGVVNGNVYYVPVYPGKLSGITIMEQGQTLISVNKEITLQAGKIYNLDMPADMSPWMLYDNYGEGTPIAVSKEGDFHVAKNVPANTNGYIFSKDGMQSSFAGAGSATTAFAQWDFTGNEPFYLTEGQNFDIYLTDDASLYFIAPAGTPIENIPAIPYTEEYALYDDVADKTVKLLDMGDTYVAKNMPSSENYVIIDKENNKYGVAAEWAEPSMWYALGAVDNAVYKPFAVNSYSPMPATVRVSADGKWFGYEMWSKLPALPAKSDWGMLGSYQGWNQENLTPMYMASDWNDNEYAVAYGVNLPANAAFKFKKGDTWMGNADTTLDEGWNYTGGNDIKVSAAGIYDIYLKPDGSLFTILPAGSAIPSAPEFETITITAYNYSGWADNTVNVYAFSGATILSNAWPGTAMTATSEGVLTATISVMKSAAPETIQFIFNNGSAQTDNSQEFAYATSYTIYFTASSVLTEAPKMNAVKENCLYLKPNSNWTTAGAKFVALFCNGTKGEKWIPMTKVGDNGYYEVEIPGTLGSGKEYKNVLFLRVDPSKTTYNWNNGSVWNQTNDLTVATGMNAYTVTEGAWSNGGGSWSAITEY